MSSAPANRYTRRKVKLTQRQAYVFDKLKAGEQVCVTNLRNGEREYTLTGGFRMDADVFSRLNKLGFLASNNDGLLPDDPQSYSLAPYVEKVA